MNTSMVATSNKDSQVLQEFLSEHLSKEKAEKEVLKIKIQFAKQLIEMKYPNHVVDFLDFEDKVSNEEFAKFTKE